MTKKRWDLWELDEDVSIGRPFIGVKGAVFIPIDDNIWELKKGTDKKYISWLSKKITLGQDSTMKVFNKIKLNGFNDDLTLGGTSNVSGDKLFLQTSEGAIPAGSISYINKGGDSEYKLKGSTKKGRWVQLLIENVKTTIDSIGIIYRRKTTK